jgi:GNAT superfamily N-acetyltransferase
LNELEITIRLLTPADLAFADSIRALAGWNQMPQDWLRFLKYEPQGCFLAEWHGVPAGTLTTTTYGPRLGWIGMLLVHPDHRRCGIGAALLRRSLDYLGECSVACAKLDATPLGQPLYERFGFKAEAALTRWESQSIAEFKCVPEQNVLPYSPEALKDISLLDQEAFGASRAKLLSPLVELAAHCVVCGASDGTVSGYGVLRAGARAFYLGPLIARTATDARMIVQALLARAGGGSVYWDVLDENKAATDLALSFGFRAQRHLVRMTRGGSQVSPRPECQFAIADPAVG